MSRSPHTLLSARWRWRLGGGDGTEPAWHGPVPGSLRSLGTRHRHRDAARSGGSNVLPHNTRQSRRDSTPEVPESDAVKDWRTWDADGITPAMSGSIVQQPWRQPKVGSWPVRRVWPGTMAERGNRGEATPHSKRSRQGAVDQPIEALRADRPGTPERRNVTQDSILRFCQSVGAVALLSESTGTNDEPPSQPSALRGRNHLQGCCLDRDLSNNHFLTTADFGLPDAFGVMVRDAQLGCECRDICVGQSLRGGSLADQT